MATTTMANFAAGTARSYVLVGFIFYLLAAIGWSIALVVTVVTSPLWIGQVPPSVTIWFPVVVPLGVFAGVSIGFTLWSWSTLQRVDQGRYVDARTASLILGIFGLVFAYFVGGIFFLLAYGRLGEVLRPSMAAPAYTARVCVHCGRTLGWDARFCSYCGHGLPA